MYVHCRFQKYLRGLRRVLGTHGRHGGPKKLIGGQVQASPRPPPGHHVHLWPKEGKRSNPTRFGIGFGLQHWVKLSRPPRPHPDSVLGVQVLYGKLMKSVFQWIRPHVHIYFEVAGIVETSPRGHSVQIVVSPDFGPMARVSSGAP